MIPKTDPVIKNCSDGIPAIQERKPSLRQQLKETKTAEPSARPKPEKQQER